MLPLSQKFIKNLQQLSIRTRKSFLGSRQGAHVSSRRGHGLEFADYKPYTAGDDVRLLDWGVYGRSDRLYVKQFREEQDLNVLIAIDSTSSMSIPLDNPKFSYAKSLALALSCAILSSGDAVCFGTTNGVVSPRMRGTKSLTRAYSFLNQLKLVNVDSLADSFAKLSARVRLPGKCFIISDFLSPILDVEESLRAVRSRGFDVIAIQVLSDIELNLSDDFSDVLLVDAESGIETQLALGKDVRQVYKDRVLAHCSAIKSHCQKHDITYLLASTGDDLEKVLLEELPRLGVFE